VRLSGNPTIEQFKAILASVDDDDAHHILWVGYDGVVHLDPKRPNGIDEEKIKFRYETFDQGGGWTGKGAAEDEESVKRFYESLLEFWAAGRKGYMDSF
jgi:hypothetical protein